MTWFSSGTLVSSSNKPDRHDITEILLKVALSTIILTLKERIKVYNKQQDGNKKESIIKIHIKTMNKLHNSIILVV